MIRVCGSSLYINLVSKIHCLSQHVCVKKYTIITKQKALLHPVNIYANRACWVAACNLIRSRTSVISRTKCIKHGWCREWELFSCEISVRWDGRSSDTVGTTRKAQKYPLQRAGKLTTFLISAVFPYNGVKILMHIYTIHISHQILEEILYRTNTIFLLLTPLVEV